MCESDYYRDARGAEEQVSASYKTLAELEVLAQQATTWTEFRVQVRAWARQHQFLACQTTPVKDGLQISFQDETEECKKVLLKLPEDITGKFLQEFDVQSGVW
jgi:hypothetical protein